MTYLFAAVIGFVLGSIPSGLWIVKLFCGIDIRDYGSKNIGTTNVFRTVGAPLAALVLICDALKGILAVILAKNIISPELSVAVFAALCAILGHNYSLFLGFKGGKGVATGLGLILYFMPDVTVVAFLTWLVIVLVTRYVSLGSIVAAFITPLGAVYRGYPTPVLIFTFLIAAFIILRHKDNIKRLLSGTESKIKQGNKKNINKN